MSAEMTVTIACDADGCTARTTGDWDRDRYAAIDVDSEQLGWWSDPWREYDLCPDHSPWVKDKRYDYQRVQDERGYAEWQRKQRTEWEADADGRRRRLEAKMAAFDQRVASLDEFLLLWQENGGGWVKRDA